eukprot:TRINITY_DN13631_c0_g1_i1.p1 TRINITY_DN13631_c0_g1~~TRINITY_DN13631_c0_g1_i1.p1  ORF type:complete len:350 (-),score=49.00 TRINITY_DN13631_c0_g1_i1:257-1306(-)
MASACHTLCPVHLERGIHGSQEGHSFVHHQRKAPPIRTKNHMNHCLLPSHRCCHHAALSLSRSTRSTAALFASSLPAFPPSNLYFPLEVPPFSSSSPKGSTSSANRRFVESAPLAKRVTAMASVDSAAPSTSIVEHVVFMKTKPDTSPETILKMAQELQALQSLESVIHLKAGPAVALGEGGWNFALHGRYPSKEALNAYTVSRAHMRVVIGSIKPNIDDIMAVDWETPTSSASSASTTKIIHSLVFKVKEGTSDEKFAASLKGLHEAEGSTVSFAPIEATSGPNFAPARSQGHNWGLVLLHRDEEEAKAWMEHESVRKAMVEDVLPLVEGYASINFKADVPAIAEANL